MIVKYKEVTFVSKDNILKYIQSRNMNRRIRQPARIGRFMYVRCYIVANQRFIGDWKENLMKNSQKNETRLSNEYESKTLSNNIFHSSLQFTL